MIPPLAGRKLSGEYCGGISMKHFLTSAVLAISLAACATPGDQNPEDPIVFGRVDCQRSENNPTIQAAFEQDSAVCKGRAEAASLSGTSSMNGGGLVGALDKAVTQQQIGKSTIVSCMAERGYLLKRRSEHTAMCSAIAAQKAAPAPKRR